MFLSSLAKTSLELGLSGAARDFSKALGEYKYSCHGITLPFRTWSYKMNFFFYKLKFIFIFIYQMVFWEQWTTRIQWCGLDKLKTVPSSWRHRYIITIFVSSDSTFDDSKFLSRDDIDLSLIFQRKICMIRNKMWFISSQGESEEKMI